MLTRGRIAAAEEAASSSKASSSSSDALSIVHFHVFSHAVLYCLCFQ